MMLRTPAMYGDLVGRRGFCAAGSAAASRRIGPARAEGQRRHRFCCILHKGKETLETRPLPTSAGRQSCSPRSAPSTRSNYQSSTLTGHRQVAGVGRDQSGAVVEPDLRHQRLGRVTHQESGVALEFHPHADTHVDTRTASSNSWRTRIRILNLCVDTGHMAYCGGQPADHRAGPGANHLRAHQFVHPEIRERVRREKLSLAEAVRWASWSSRRMANPRCRPCWTR